MFSSFPLYLRNLFSLYHRLTEHGFNLPPLKSEFRVTRVAVCWRICCLFCWLLHWHYCAWRHQILLKTPAQVKALRSEIPQPAGPHLMPQISCCCWGVPRSASPSVLWTGANKDLRSFSSVGVHSLLKTLDIQHTLAVWTWLMCAYRCAQTLGYIYS